MKKVLAIIAIAGFMVACNNESETTKEDAAKAAADSARIADSTAAAAKAADTAAAKPVDTIKAVVDSTKK